MSGGPIYIAEYVVVEANCTDDACVPLADVMAVSTQSTSLAFHRKRFGEWKNGSPLNYYWNHLLYTPFQPRL